MSCLSVVNLTATRATRPLFSGLNFTLERGEILQIVGANGCGKTTLLKLLCGLLYPENGDILWNQRSITTHRTHYNTAMLYIGHQPGIKYVLSAQENLQLDALLMPSPQKKSISQILIDAGLSTVKNKPAHCLSVGQQQRLALARLWLTPATLWILDEPFSHLDQAAVASFSDVFTNHAQNGGMVIITSHTDLTLEGATLRTLALA